MCVVPLIAAIPRASRLPFRKSAARPGTSRESGRLKATVEPLLTLGISGCQKQERSKELADIKLAVKRTICPPPSEAGGELEASVSDSRDNRDRSNRAFQLSRYVPLVAGFW
jgi:hypothetical protein